MATNTTVAIQLFQIRPLPTSWFSPYAYDLVCMWTQSLTVQPTGTHPLGEANVVGIVNDTHVTIECSHPSGLFCEVEIKNSAPPRCTLEQRIEY